MSNNFIARVKQLFPKALGYMRSLEDVELVT